MGSPVHTKGGEGMKRRGKLTQLGQAGRHPASPQEAQLESVPNPHADTDYLIRFTAPEFTTLCPITGQPDFAHFVIDYCPAKAILESKSLKLFLGSFRNHAGFHEDSTVLIGKRIGAVAGGLGQALACRVQQPR